MTTRAGVWVIVLGLIGIAAVVATWPSSGGSPTHPVAASQPTVVPTPTVMPTVGWAVENRDWRVHLLQVQTAALLGDAYSRARAQGKFVILTVRAENQQRQTSALNVWDFAMKSPAGTTYQVSTSGSTALLMSGDTSEPMYISEEVQPGLGKQFSLVFDVDPRVPSYTLTAAGMEFKVDI